MASSDSAEQRAVEGLARRALRLSEEARATLAARLIESLDVQSARDIKRASDAEIAKRLDEIDAGEVKLIPWSAARKQIFRRSRGKARP